MHRSSYKKWSKTINIPDTVGYAIPGEFKELIKKIKIKFLILIKLLFLCIAIMIWD